jgi:hypothetical protein
MMAEHYLDKPKIVDGGRAIPAILDTAGSENGVPKLTVEEVLAQINHASSVAAKAYRTLSPRRDREENGFEGTTRDTATYNAPELRFGRVSVG